MIQLVRHLTKIPIAGKSVALGTSVKYRPISQIPTRIEIAIEGLVNKDITNRTNNGLFLIFDDGSRIQPPRCPPKI